MNAEIPRKYNNNDLAKVDEVHESGEIVHPDVGEKKDRVLGRVNGLQNVLEVAGAGAEDDPVRLHGVPLARQRHVRKVNIVP